MNTSTLRLTAVIAAAVAVTAVAAAAGTAAVTGDDRTLSPQDVDQLLAGQTDGPGATTSSGTSSPTSSATDNNGAKVHSLTPGTVTVRCDGDVATLLSWSPNPGFRSDDPVTGPAATVSVRFESDIYADYKVTATCPGGTASVVLGPDDDDHGGRDDDHGGRGDDDDGYDDHGGNRGRGGSDD